MRESSVNGDDQSSGAFSGPSLDTLTQASAEPLAVIRSLGSVPWRDERRHALIEPQSISVLPARSGQLLAR